MKQISNFCQMKCSLKLKKKIRNNEITYNYDIFNGALIILEGHILVIGGPNLKTFGLMAPQRNN